MLTGNQELRVRLVIHRLIRPYFVQVKTNPMVTDEACDAAAATVARQISLVWPTKKEKTTMSPDVCEYCGTELPPGSDSKFCSEGCKEAQVAQEELDVEEEEEE